MISMLLQVVLLKEVLMTLVVTMELLQEQLMVLLDKLLKVEKKRKVSGNIMEIISLMTGITLDVIVV